MSGAAPREAGNDAVIEITAFTKADGPLTKRISLGPDGKPVSDGSACLMARGRAQRIFCKGLGAFAAHIERLQTNQAIGLGSLRDDLIEQADVVTAQELTRLNGASAPHVIARTSNSIVYKPGQPALVLLDYDRKGMPRAVAERIGAAGGFWPALVAAVPALATAGRVERASTSAALYRTDTTEPLPGSGGAHVFIAARDGADAERFLKTLHERAWLGGLGWLMVGASGQLLDRSVVDRMVGAAERLVFEAPPILEPPIAQDSAARRAIVRDGDILDTEVACPPLTIVERATLDKLWSAERHRLAPEATKVRAAFVSRQSGRLAERTGLPPKDAARVVERWLAGVLLPHLALPFDDPDLAGTTVAEILAAPGKFEGATLADPLEGPSYGTCKAKVMLRADGTPWIHSFAHGRTTYELRYDAGFVGAEIERAPKEDAATVLTRLAPLADLDAADIERLRDLASDRAGVGKRAIARDIKAACERRNHQRDEEERARREAERRDPRPRLPAPPPDAPWLPQMEALNEVLAASRDPEPPARDIDGSLVQVRVRRVPNTHSLTPRGANGDEQDEDRLPPPEQPLLTRLGEAQAAELIERHIDYADPAGRSVHLGAAFVRHFLSRGDGALPTETAISTLPLVLSDGTLLARRGLDRERGIVFRAPPELLALVPRQEDCKPTPVAEAMRFLTDEWLVDVATDYSGKCVLIAAALTVIERSLLPERPTFFVTAGRRGGGKTTALIMLLMAVTGVRPSAAAWSPNEEERRKSLLAYLMDGLPALIWDNIPRGAALSCPHIEKSCTTALYSDRKLGVSETVAVAASLVHCFTGNNILPKGDLASRSLLVRLEVERPDPENRPFRHPDPVGWTESNRGKILAALFTVLLGNPALDSESDKPAETRFKTWWRLVGAAVEHAALRHAEHVGGLVTDPLKNCPPAKVSFKDLFLSREADDEESANLADLLEALATKWPKGASFQASDIAKVANDQSEYVIESDKQLGAVVRDVLYPKALPSLVVTPRSLGKALGKHVGEPVARSDRTLVLKTCVDPHDGARATLSYLIQVKP